MERTITVKGTGTVTAVPDQIVVLMKLKSLEREYGMAVSGAAEMLEDLRELLADVGFRKEDIKTTNFSVNSEYENYRDENDNYKSMFVGFACKYDLKIVFDKDMKRLSEILYSISRSSIEPKIEIRFTVKDQDKISNDLLACAVADAKEKAAVLSETAGVSLGDIITINYDWEDVNFKIARCECVSLSLDDCCDESDYSFDFEPDDIKASDTVTVVWEIK